MELADVDVVFAQSHEGEEEDVSVQTPDEEKSTSKETSHHSSFHTWFSLPGTLKGTQRFENEQIFLSTL